MEPKYELLGKLLSQLRENTETTQHFDIANLVKANQTIVNRWEKGISRPNLTQLRILGEIYKVDYRILLEAAGYKEKAEVATFDKPFPLGALNPDSFERFCLYFLAKLLPAANVHRVGSSGHTQDGIDVDAVFPDQTTFSFQCKRVDTFGPAKVEEVISKHTRIAKKKFLLLSRVATPKARMTIEPHSEWDIWDIEDISRVIRQELTKEHQIRLVDIFFSGQRLSLLGVTEAGPWQDFEQFYAPFLEVSKAFSHRWKLIGRQREAEALLTFINTEHISCVLLIGSGGSGKSKLIKDVISDFETNNHNAILIRFLSPTEDVTSRSLQELGQGQKILVIDDTHDRKDLQLLFQYVANPNNKTKLILASRPYGIDYIKSHASNFGISSENITTIRLNALDLNQTTLLAEQVLNEFGGPAHFAKHIAKLTLDCPLATVMGAQVVATQPSPIEFIKNQDLFRITLLAKFQDTIAGEIGSKSDSYAIKKLLKVLSLIQPFHPEEKILPILVDYIEQIPPTETQRLTRLLNDAGVLFKRGGRYRIAPDLLGDYIIEQTCIGINGISTGYAEKLFDYEDTKYIENILVNLGKLDWRLNDGDPKKSRLLDGIWGKLKPKERYSDPYIKAVTAVAYYQPNHALDFAEKLIISRENLHDLPPLIKHTAYSLEHINRACECLWELGRGDSRELHSNPGHAIRILSELCSVEPFKPIEFNQAVVEFCLHLIQNQHSFDNSYTPLDILSGLFKTEGHTTKSNVKSFTFEPFFVDPTFISTLRNKVIDFILRLLTSNHPHVAIKAAQFIQKALYYPRGLFGAVPSMDFKEGWTNEHVITLNKLLNLCATSDIHPLVFIEILRSASFHIHHTTSPTHAIAHRLLSLVPSSLHFRTTIMLIDGYSLLFKEIDFNVQQSNLDNYLHSLSAELISQFITGEDLRYFIETIMIDIDLHYNGTKQPSPVLYRHLLQSSNTLAKATLDATLTVPNSKTNAFTSISLSKLLAEESKTGVIYARSLIDTNIVELQIAVANSYAYSDKRKNGFSREDIEILKTLLSSTNSKIAHNAVYSIHNVASVDKDLAIELLNCVDISSSVDLASEVLTLFYSDNSIPFNLLTSSAVENYLNKLVPILALDGHWIDSFLSKASLHHPSLTFAFFVKRVNFAAHLNNWQYRPCNYGPYINVALRFRESNSCNTLLREAADWIKSENSSNYLFLKTSCELFYAMFAPIDLEMIEFLTEWAKSGDSEDLIIISQILSEADSSIFFEHHSFVILLYELAYSFGKSAIDALNNGLHSAAISGVKSGVPGEPFPKDIMMRDESSAILADLPRFSPAYQFYQNIKHYAEIDIRRSYEEGEAYDD